jgi:hypothetical protein
MKSEKVPFRRYCTTWTTGYTQLPLQLLNMQQQYLQIDYEMKAVP